MYLKFHIAQPLNDQGVVFKRKVDEKRFLVGRDGDSLLKPFQCDLCWFRNIQKRSPRENSRTDGQLLGYIRRINLDLLRGRSNGTVVVSLVTYKKGLEAADELGIPPSYEYPGPWHVEDDIGCGCALEMLIILQKKGRHQTTHQQYDTISKIRTLHWNIYESSS